MFTYWIGSNQLNLFTFPKIESIAFSDGQILTGNNEKYIRSLWEVDFTSVSKTGKWMLHAKGGEFRKWYGNLDSLVAWDDKSRKYYREDRIARFPKEEILFRKGITWTLVSSSAFGTRILPETQTFNKAAATLLFYNDKYINYVLAFTNSKVASSLMRMLNPTLNNNIRDVLQLPFIFDNNFESRISELAQENIYIEKIDWDSFETSWDFKKHPLI